MIDYKTMYAIMFNAATDAINILSENKEPNQVNIQRCIALLSAAQIACEELYICADE